MKISIAWLFDHIEADWSKLDIADLCTKFNASTAEIEGWYKVSVDVSHLFLAQVVATGQQVSATTDDAQKIVLPERADAVKNSWYVVRKDGTSYQWGTAIDFGGHKEMLLPAVVYQKDWKKKFETIDYILEVDNKSITNRPDMWGHRGIAREVAALLNLSLKPYDQFLASRIIQAHDSHAVSSGDMPFSIALKNPVPCKRFAGYYISSITSSPSLLWMVSRLARIDSRALDALVDMTNYVMFDISQPMHAFDAGMLAHKQIEVRNAQLKEKLLLLDNTVVELTPRDMVIADGKTAVALAGIMGGKQSAVTARTTSLFLEAANFDATPIRQTAQQYKLRTEASARFEKSFDPNQNVDAILRYLKLLDDAGIAYKGSKAIASIGALAPIKRVEIAHNFIEKRLGVSLPASFIITTLTKLGFGVHEKNKQSEAVYDIAIPSNRATKDIGIKEDIVEEVGRFYGYSTIPFELPALITKPIDTHAQSQIYAIKSYLAFGAHMHELSSYSFFDESFLKECNWQPDNPLQVKNPVSENWHRLVTTIMPHMFRAVRENHIHHDALRFFEYGRVWDQKNDISERKKLVGIFYSKKAAINFYDAKAIINDIYCMIGASVQWQSITDVPFPWFNHEQTASLLYEGKSVGVAGMIDARFQSFIAEGNAFVFELDGEFFENYRRAIKRFVPLQKYPAVERDISIMVPLELTVDVITEAIKKVDTHIHSITLIDFFQKKEWKDQKSLTFRYVMYDEHKTMTKPEADHISARVVATVESLGAVIR